MSIRYLEYEKEFGKQFTQKEVERGNIPTKSLFHALIADMKLEHLPRQDIDSLNKNLC